MPSNVDRTGAGLVLDNGSLSMKAGFAGDMGPISVFRTVVGSPKAGLGDPEDSYVGEEAQRKRATLSLRYPVCKGVIYNWDDMEKIWQHTFQELSVCPEEHHVLLTEGPLNDSKNRECMAEIMFEKFKVPSLFISIQAVLALIASGRTDGVVLDSGYEVTHAVPISGGHALLHTVTSIPAGGRDVTEYLRQLMREAGVDVKCEQVEDIKEALCYVSANFDGDLETAENSSSLEKTYELPDGTSVTLGNERFKSPEALFRPNLIGVVCDSMHELVYKAIVRCEKGIRKELYENILLTGGNTMFGGLADRVQAEVTVLAPENVHVQVVAQEDRSNSVWVGGSILAAMPAHEETWVFKETYEEYGKSCVETTLTQYKY